MFFLTEGVTAGGSRFWSPNGSGTENCALLLRKPVLVLRFSFIAACLAVAAVISRSSSDSKIGTPAQVKDIFKYNRILFHLSTFDNLLNNNFLSALCCLRYTVYALLAHLPKY
jgi:hypothetical protein